MVSPLSTELESATVARISARPASLEAFVGEPLLQVRPALRNRPHDRCFGGFVFRAVDDLDRARDVIARDGREGLVFKMNQVVGVALGAVEEFAFLRGEPELSQTFHGHVAIAVLVQFPLERVVVTAVARGGVRADGGSEPVAAPGELFGVIEHFPPLLIGLRFE